MSPPRRTGWGLAVLLVTGLLLAGCGKKADPRPTGVPPPPVIADLSAAAGPAGATLRWSLPGRTEGPWVFRIQRSDSGEADFCATCPQDYRPRTELSGRDGRLQRTGERGYGYTDTDLRPGQVYLYRIVVCEPYGPCGAPSNSAGPIRKGP